MIPALSQNSLPVGILMNRASFPRLPGDIGNPATFPFAVRYRMVPGTTYHDVVEALQEERLLVPFIAAAQALEQEGVCAITTSCGFLALFQRQLSAAVRVPVYTSALLQLPMIAAALPPGKRVGILTADSANLTPRHLAAAGASYCPVTVMGMEHTTEFSSFLREDRTSFDAEKCRQEHIEAALELIRRDPGIGAILLECTNMPPWALDIHLATACRSTTSAPCCAG